MANTFGSHVWTLDTAGAIWSYTTQGPIKISKIIFEPSASGQSAALDETDGGELCTFNSSIDATPIGDQEFTFPGGKWFDGLTLTSISSGAKVKIYFD